MGSDRIPSRGYNVKKSKGKKRKKKNPPNPLIRYTSELVYSHGRHWRDLLAAGERLQRVEYPSTPGMQFNVIAARTNC
jgi:hypothetical protein